FFYYSTLFDSRFKTLQQNRMNHAIELRKTTFKTVKEICSITGVSEASFYRRWSELMKEKKIIKILKNKARCKRCDDVIESKHSHDFVTCKCGAISLDGGLEYQRLSFKNSIDDYDFSLSEYEEIEPEPKKEK
ncbi:DUF7695 domain-containing protein, partial [Marinilactibacillus psychrotolerans]|uniref:DUF7695 domain-containing protein n=1 Tax=Marinilactibacillus psychrotolerans TaxID=191770 RepID=UPI00351EF9EF